LELGLKTPSTQEGATADPPPLVEPPPSNPEGATFFSLDEQPERFDAIKKNTQQMPKRKNIYLSVKTINP
jgi:hypothetical protein